MRRHRTNRLKLAIIATVVMGLSLSCAVAFSCAPLRGAPLLTSETRGEFPRCLKRAKFEDRSFREEQYWGQSLKLDVEECDTNLVIEVEDNVQLGITKTGDLYNLGTMKALDIVKGQWGSAAGTYTPDKVGEKEPMTQTDDRLLLKLTPELPAQTLRWWTTDSDSTDLTQRFAKQTKEPEGVFELVTTWGERPEYIPCPPFLDEEEGCGGCGSITSPQPLNGSLLALLVGLWFLRRRGKST